MQIEPNLSTEYILESFISGLRGVIKPFVRAFYPNSLTETIKIARL